MCIMRYNYFSERSADFNNQRHISGNVQCTCDTRKILGAEEELGRYGQRNQSTWRTEEKIDFCKAERLHPFAVSI